MDIALPQARASAVPAIARITPFLLVAAMLVPLFAVSLPPLVDLLGHTGRYAIQTGLHDHPWLGRYFDFHWRVIGNLGADLLVEPLSRILDIETSVWIIVALNQLLASAGILLLCREVHGRITPFCLFALPLIYSLPFNYGFINYTLSMALALLAFTLWLRLGRTGHTVARAWSFVPIGLALWVCHTFGWAFLGILCAAESLARSDEAGRTAPRAMWDAMLRCAPLAAPLIPMLLWRSQASGPQIEGMLQIYHKFVCFRDMLRLDNAVLDKMSVAAVAAVVALGFIGRSLTRDPRIVMAATLCLSAYVILPQRLFASDFADMRLAPYIMIVALLAIGDGSLSRPVRSWLTIAGVVFLTLRIVATTTAYDKHERILDDHLEALQAIPERARVATIVALDCPGEWSLPWLSHIGSMAIVRKHAFTNDQWSVGSVNLLSVHYPEAEPFRVDPSQLSHEAECGPGFLPTPEQAAAKVPAKAFTHVWIVGAAPGRRPPRPDLVEVWRNRDAAVYRFVESR